MVDTTNNTIVPIQTVKKFNSQAIQAFHQPTGSKKVGGSQIKKSEKQEDLNQKVGISYTAERLRAKGSKTYLDNPFLKHYHTVMR